jgi:uncharacterized repeat protein (TIGR03803 family)
MKLRLSRPLAVAGLAVACYQQPAGALGGAGPALVTLVSFNGSNGAEPLGRLIVDASGNLFGTTILGGGPNGQGTVFEIVKTASGYASAPTTLVTFNGSNGAEPHSGLIADAAGNLFGTTQSGGSGNFGTLFELVNKGGGSYTLATLVSFDGTNGASPMAGLIADANSNLFGTTVGVEGANPYGTVFELVNKSGGSYSFTPLVSFDGTNGAAPLADLIIDAAGNLFGTTNIGTTNKGGVNNGSTVFEIVKTSTGYASNPTTLATFNGGPSGISPSRLIFDAGGNLLGTTQFGGATDQGTVFEIAKSATGYASTPTILVNFNSNNNGPFEPDGGLIADAAGNLFGTAVAGGLNNSGAVFEIVKTGSGYAGTPTTLINFTPSAASPGAGLVADPAGNLFGVTEGNEGSDPGTVFEITGSGFVTPIVIPPSEITTTASGLAYSRVSRTFDGTMTITNISGSPISGPFSILFTGLTSGVTLANATGSHSGSPYLAVPAVASLAVGQSATVTEQFSDPSFGPINSTPVVYSGSL